VCRYVATGWIEGSGLSLEDEGFGYSLNRTTIRRTATVPRLPSAISKDLRVSWFEDDLIVRMFLNATECKKWKDLSYLALL
jgi:hypothetical protein